VPEALRLYRDLLAGVTLPAQDVGGPMPEELLRLRALRQAHLPRVDLLPTRRYPLNLEADGDHYRAAVRDTSQVGTYNLHLRASGRSRRSGRRFQRSRLVSVRVE
jgi:predicted ATPase